MVRAYPLDLNKSNNISASVLGEKKSSHRRSTTT